MTLWIFSIRQNSLAVNVCTQFCSIISIFSYFFLHTHKGTPYSNNEKKYVCRKWVYDNVVSFVRVCVFNILIKAIVVFHCRWWILWMSSRNFGLKDYLWPVSILECQLLDQVLDSQFSKLLNQIVHLNRALRQLHAVEVLQNLQHPSMHTSKVSAMRFRPKEVEGLLEPKKNHSLHEFLRFFATWYFHRYFVLYFDDFPIFDSSFFNLSKSPFKLFKYEIWYCFFDMNFRSNFMLTEFTAAIEILYR